MDIVWLRDLVICILGSISVVVLIFFAVIVYLLFRRVNAMMDAVHLFYQRTNSALDSMESTLVNVRGIVSNVGYGLITPVAQLMAIIKGVQEGVNVFNRVFKKKGGEENG